MAWYLGLSTALTITFRSSPSDSYRILKAFFNSPRAKAIFPSSSEVLDISVCSNPLAVSRTYLIMASHYPKLLQPISNSPSRFLMPTTSGESLALLL